MSDRPTLVRESWARRVDDALFTSNGAGPNDGAASLFYDVRPARLQTAWSQNTAGVWVATARFIVNDAVDDSFTFPVYAPAATSDPGGTAETTRFFVVWRGRWEMVARGKMTKQEIILTLDVTETSKNVVAGLTTTINANGFLTISATSTTINYYETN